MCPIEVAGATSGENHRVDNHRPTKEAFTKSLSVFKADMFPNLQSTTGNA